MTADGIKTDQGAESLPPRGLRVRIDRRTAGSLTSLFSAIGGLVHKVRAGSQTVVIARFAADYPAFLEDRVETFLHNLDPRGRGTLETCEGDAPWQPGWKALFSGLDVAGFSIVPPWRDAALTTGDPIVVNPRGGFGSGGHPTTRACLTALRTLEAWVPGTRALDVGCGTGILAVAAARLGASVTGIDLEASCRERCRATAAANGLANKIAVSDSRLETLGESFDLVLANVDPVAIKSLASALQERLRPDGHLILGGFRPEDQACVRSRYGDLAEVASITCEDWASWIFRSPAVT